MADTSPDAEPQPAEQTEEEWLAALHDSDPDEWLRITDAQAWVELHDERPFVVTSKRINPGQLTRELGYAITCDATAHVDDTTSSMVKISEEGVGSQKELDAAVAAHVAEPIPTNEERRAAIIDAAPDWQSAMKELGNTGLLA